MSGVNIFSRLLESGIPTRNVQVALSTTEIADRQVATQTNHDNLNTNANMQVGDGDVAQNNPVHSAGSEVENGAVANNVMLVGGRYDYAGRILSDGSAGAIGLTATGAIMSAMQISNLDIGPSNPMPMTGSAQEGEPINADPVVVGGRYDNADRDVDDGDALALALNHKGHVLVSSTAHDNLQCNSNLQVNDMDNSASNPAFARELDISYGSETLSSVPSHTTSDPLNFSSIIDTQRMKWIEFAIKPSYDAATTISLYQILYSNSSDMSTIDFFGGIINGSVQSEGIFYPPQPLESWMANQDYQAFTKVDSFPFRYVRVHFYHETNAGGPGDTLDLTINYRSMKYL